MELGTHHAGKSKLANDSQGPCRISDGNGTSFHPESWNTNANIFFVDQPIGVGFSYAEYGEAVVSFI